MRKILYPKPLLPALLIVASAGLQAQDRGETADAEDWAGGPPPADFVQKGQVVPVAEQDVDDADEVTVPEQGEPADSAESDDARLADEFELFKQLMDDNVLDEADNVAKRVVELALDVHGPGSNEFAKALTNLAIVQFRNEQYDASIQNFESAIEIIEDNEDRLNSQLVNPLKGLGAAQLEYGRPDLASQTFQRAVHVTHVNEGPHNLDQVELLESIAETFIRMGDIDAAKDAQDTIYALNVREYEVDALALVPALMRRAEWQHRAGFVFDERATYRRAIRIIEEGEGKDSLNLVEPLILLGRSYFYPDTSGQASFHEATLSTGEVYFRRAVRIASDSPDNNWQTVAQATLALGDYYMYGNNSQRAGQVYVDAWNLLSEGEEQLAVRHDQLEQVVPLRQEKFPLYVSSDDDQATVDRNAPMLQGRVAFSYAVTTRGRVDDLTLIEAQPAEFEKMIGAVQREVRRRIYRPRMQDGEVVTTTDLVLTHKFFYRQSDLDAARSGADDS